ALIDYSRRQAPDTEATLAIVSSARTIAAASIAGLERYATGIGWRKVRTIDLDRTSRSSGILAGQVKASKATHLLVVGDDRAASDVVAMWAAEGWTSDLLIPGALATSSVLGIHSAAGRRIFLAVPSLPSDQSAAGSAEYRALADTYKLPATDVAAQIAALCAAKVLTQGLTLAGRTVSRAALVEALEGLSGFDTGLMPRIGFGPNRRIGAPGAYIVEADPVAKQFKQVTPWIDVE